MCTGKDRLSGGAEVAEKGGREAGAESLHPYPLSAAN